MSRITSEEFWKAWDKSEYGETVLFQLSADQIQEWIRHGKFSKIKDYCVQLPYDVKFICMKPAHEMFAKAFGFVFESWEDGNKLLNLFESILHLRTCIEVEKLSIQEIDSEANPTVGHGKQVLADSFCPLVI